MDPMMSGGEKNISPALRRFCNKKAKPEFNQASKSNHWFAGMIKD